MPRKTALRSSRGTKPDNQPQRYGLRDRSAQQAISNSVIVHDAGHETFAKRTKRTPSSTRSQSSISNGSINKSAERKPAPRRAKKNKNKFWLAEAILEENDTQYRIRYKPVYKGAQAETSWQPKHYANAALRKDWEERRMAVAHGSCNADYDLDSMSKDDETGQRSDSVGRGSPGATLLTVTSTIIPEDSAIHTPELNAAAAAEMYHDHKNRGLHESSAAALHTLEDGSAPPPHGRQILNHGPSEGDTVEGNLGKPTPRPGTSISTLLSTAPRTLSDENKDDESSTFVGNQNSQALPRVSTEVKVPKNRDTQSGPPGKLASAREQLRLLLQGPGKRRYRKSQPRSPPSP